MVRPEWVIFDVGVVLLDWPESVRAAARRLNVSEERLLQELKAVAKRMNVGEQTANDGWTAIIERLGSNVSAREIIDLWYSNQFWHADSLALLERLSAHTNTALFSNSWLDLRNGIANNILPQALKSAQLIFDSSEIGLIKPDPAIYEYVEATLQVPPAKIFLIDDDERNTSAAKARGWQAYHYISGPDKGKRSNSELRILLNNT